MERTGCSGCGGWGTPRRAISSRNLFLAGSTLSVRPPMGSRMARRKTSFVDNGFELVRMMLRTWSRAAGITSWPQGRRESNCFMAMDQWWMVVTCPSLASVLPRVSVEKFNQSQNVLIETEPQPPATKLNAVLGIYATQLLHSTTLSHTNNPV